MISKNDQSVFMDVAVAIIGFIMAVYTRGTEHNDPVFRDKNVRKCNEQ